MHSLDGEKIKPLIKVAIVAGEKSSDQLGSKLMESIIEDYPGCHFLGVGDKKMEKLGLKSFFNLEKISVMGIWEPLKKLPELLKIRRNLKTFLLENNPDIFIGIDAPDFNLPIAKFLKAKGSIPTVQYVSPSVWAWRKGRIRTIERSIDLMLTLFPFEKEVYKNSSVNVKYVGHPLAHDFNYYEDFPKDSLESKTIALMPGSRKSEIQMLAPLMLEAAHEIQLKHKGIKFIMPLADKDHLKFFDLKKKNLHSIEVIFNDSHKALELCDYGIITSGTASLEALLLGVPSLVIYKTSWLNFKLIKPFLKIKHISLPNLLSNEQIIPELLQDEVTIENIVRLFEQLISEDKTVLLKKFKKLHIALEGAGKNSAKNEILKFYSQC